MSSSRIERKLAAIMFTDIAGYTALSAKDSTKASELLKTQRNTLKPIVEKHGGSWIKEIGDGLLLTFNSATSAIECSIAIQEATKDMEDLNLRIGIHEGEVIKQDGDVIGDDVNVASRIEPFSAIGGVAISDKIYRAISSNSEFETKYIGKPKLKGVSQEVKVYCITSHGLPETDVSKISKQLPISKKKVKIIASISIVMVLILGLIGWYIYPFIFILENVNRKYEKSIAITYFDYEGDSTESYWSFGLTDELISRVSKIENIKVSSRLDVDPNVLSASIFQIRKDLGVDYVLRGRIIKIDTQIKISVKLIDTKNESILWSESYVRKIQDILQLQIELAKDIIDNLSDEININNDYEQIAYTESFEAYKSYLELDSFMKGQYFHTIEDFNALLDEIDMVLKLDNNYTKALEIKVLFLFIKSMFLLEGNEDVKTTLKMNSIIEEINIICENILKIDNNSKFAILGQSVLPLLKSLSLSIPEQLLSFRYSIQKAKKLFDMYPESIQANWGMALLYDMKIEYLPFSSNEDMQKSLIYTDKIIEQSNKYIRATSIDFLDLVTIQAAYYHKDSNSELSLEQREMMFNNLYLLDKNNHYLTGQRDVNQKLIWIAREKNDIQRVIEIMNENLALSKLVNSKRTATWANMDLHLLYYHDLNNYSTGLEYLENALGHISDIDMWEGENPVNAHCHYAQDLSIVAQYAKAEEQINIASQFSSSKLDSFKLSYTIGFLYYNQEDYQSAVDNFILAGQYLSDEVHDHYDPLYYHSKYKKRLFLIGNSYMHLGEYDDAIEYFKQCFEYEDINDQIFFSLYTKLALTYALKGQLVESKNYYHLIEELYNIVENKQFWTLYRINKIYNNNLALSYLDSSYTHLLNMSQGYTNEEERNAFLTLNKDNKRIQEEWEKVK